MIAGDGFARFAASLYRRTVFRLTLRLADQIIVVSAPWRDYLANVEPAVANKLTVIPTGVDLDVFVPTGEPIGTGLLYVSVLDRFHRYKGLDTLLAAVAGLDCEFDLIVVGDGDLRSEYERQAAEFGIRHSVHFTGRIGDDELKSLYSQAGVYILPSTDARREAGFTLTALEAMASGVPVVIAGGAGAIGKEVELHSAGINVPAGDVLALRKAIKSLLEDSTRRMAFGRAARAYVEQNLSWDTIVEERRGIYESAVNAAWVRRHKTRSWSTFTARTRTFRS